jgi:hypothetical protein
MSRVILDRYGKELMDITPQRQEQIDKILDKLHIPKEGCVQLNVGKITKVDTKKDLE